MVANMWFFMLIAIIIILIVMGYIGLALYGIYKLIENDNDVFDDDDIDIF